MKDKVTFHSLVDLLFFYCMVTEKNSDRDLSFNTQNHVVFLSNRTLRMGETNTKNTLTPKMLVISSLYFKKP